MAAMIIHGVQPGPMLMVNQPQFVYDVVAMTCWPRLGMLFFGLFWSAAMAVIRIPAQVIMPVIMVLCTVGSFAISSRLFDVYIMLFIGVCAFLCGA
jgi:putative tricarboxylic transport membrane protein